MEWAIPAAETLAGVSIVSYLSMMGARALFGVLWAGFRRLKDFNNSRAIQKGTIYKGA
jgi:hypothetical protein